METLRETINNYRHQDMPLQSIKDDLNVLLDEVEMSGGSQSLLHVAGSLSSNQILNIHSSPPEVLPQPGSGKGYIPLYGTMVILGGSIAYTGGGDIKAGPPAHIGDSILAFAGTGDALQNFGGPAGALIIGAAVGGSFDPGSSFDNASLVLNAASDFAAGNGTLEYSIYYELVDLV